MTTQQAPHHGRPGSHATVVDQPDELLPNRELVDDLLIEDAEVEVRAYPGVVRAGLGATVWAHPGVVVDAEDGAVVYLAPGASLEEWRPGALERGTVHIIRWDPSWNATTDPGVQRRCAVCGCTDDRACPGRCSWVAADLCSTCLHIAAAAYTQRLGLTPLRRTQELCHDPAHRRHLPDPPRVSLGLYGS